jgi:hypothetical protein
VRRVVGLLAVVIALVGAIGVGAVVRSGDEEPQALAVTAPALQVRGEGDGSVMVPVHGFVAAEALVPGLEVFAEPGLPPGTPPASVSANPTWEGFPLVLSVIDRSADGAWLDVRLPQRPNGSTGWVRAADVRTWDVPNRIQVSVGESTLRVFQGDSDVVLFQAAVGVGRGATPTPLGDFYIDIVNPLGGHPTYGWGQLSVAGFSEVHHSFGGGIGQIALHGWNNPGTVLGDVSNGCVRMVNDDIARVAELAPLGTPVQIVA